MAQTHCKNGHEFTAENTRHYTGPDGYTRRCCRDCERLRGRNTRLSIKAACLVRGAW